MGDLRVRCVYVVGQNGTILYYDDTSWTSITSNSTEWLFGVHGSATDAYAVGDNGTILHMLTGSTPEPTPSLSWWGMAAGVRGVAMDENR